MEELTLEDCNFLNGNFLRNFRFFSDFPFFVLSNIGSCIFKGKHGKDLTEVKEIKKRWQEYTEELDKKGLIDPDNDDDVVTHLEPDILESEVKWALGRIKTTKASESDGIPAELVQILKDDAIKELHSVCQQIWKTQQWHRTRKDQFSFQSQRIFKLSYNCTYFTCQQHYAQNPSS